MQTSIRKNTTYCCPHFQIIWNFLLFRRINTLDNCCWIYVIVDHIFRHTLSQNSFLLWLEFTFFWIRKHFIPLSCFIEHYCRYPSLLNIFIFGIFLCLIFTYFSLFRLTIVLRHFFLFYMSFLCYLCLFIFIFWHRVIFINAGMFLLYLLIFLAGCMLFCFTFGLLMFVDTIFFSFLSILIPGF